MVVFSGEKQDAVPALEQQYSLTDSYSPNSDDFPAPAPQGSPWREEDGPQGSPFDSKESTGMYLCIFL